MSETDKDSSEPRLLADAMLGKLARWLRLLGLDTLFDPNWDDAEIVRIARAEHRLVLTRDRLLCQRAGIDSVLIESDRLAHQVHQIIDHLGLPSLAPGTRCSVCNGQLEEVSIDLVHHRIPPYVRQNHTAFHRCQTCDRIYWQGGHWQRIRLQIDQFMRVPGSASQPDVSNGPDTDSDPHRFVPLN